MLDSDGTTQYERQNIADIFVTFYEQLYNGTKRNTQNNLKETNDTTHHNQLIFRSP